jgi:hypothetical protein
MSAYWASRKRALRSAEVRVRSVALDANRMRRLRAAAAVGVLALLMALGAALQARAATVADSGRVIKRVMIDQGGVRVDRGGTRRSITINDRYRDSVGPSVRIMGPVVIVDGEGDGLVRVFSDAEVKPGEHVEGDVVAVFGSVSVSGQVAGNVVSVFGNVTLEPGATVDGDAVAVGGVVRQPPGASIGGQSVSLGLLPVAWGLPALPVLLGMIAIGWLITLFFAWILNMLFPERLLRAAITSSRRTGLSLLLGILSLPVMLISVVLLLMTVIGIPVALLLPIFYHFLSWAGQVAATYVLGCKILRRPLGSGGATAPIATGAAFIAMFFVAGALLATGSGAIRTMALFFDLLGLLLLTGLSTIGTGAFLLSRFGSQPRDLLPEAVGTVSPVAPVAPAAPYAGA